MPFKTRKIKLLLLIDNQRKINPRLNWKEFNVHFLLIVQMRFLFILNKNTTTS